MKFPRTLTLGVTSLALLAVGTVGVSAQAPTIKIGSDNFYESKLLAEIWAQTLEGQGWTVDRQLGLGARPERAPAFEAGQVDLVPEYVGSGHGIFDPTKAGTDGEANARALEAAYAAAGTPVTVLGLTPGQDSNAAVVRADTAAEFGLTKMSDLVAVQDQLRWGLPPDCDANPFCKDALEKYGLTYPPAQRESLAACDAPIAEALANDAIDFAWLCSTQPAIVQYGFVQLEDDLHTQAAENLAPLVRNAFFDSSGVTAEQLGAILDPISAAMTTEKLLELGVRVGVDNEDLADVAAEFLAAIQLPAGSPAASAAASPAASAAASPAASPAS
jgi:osmoprotectant transport system substrate-binding protein